MSLSLPPSADLALKLVLAHRDFPICLVSSVNQEQLEANLSAATAEISTEEARMLQELDAKFFRYLTVNHWENLEVTDYWKKMKAGGHVQKTDL